MPLCDRCRVNEGWKQVRTYAGPVLDKDRITWACKPCYEIIKAVLKEHCEDVENDGT